MSRHDAAFGVHTAGLAAVLSAFAPVESLLIVEKTNSDWLVSSDSRGKFKVSIYYYIKFS